MMAFFKIWPENIKKAFITLQALRFKLNSLSGVAWDADPLTVVV